MAGGVTTAVESRHVVDALASSRVVHLTAEDGVAGTRLLVDVAEAATTDGWAVVSVRGAGRDVPLAALGGIVPFDADGVLAQVVGAMEAIRDRGDRVAVLIDDAALVDDVSAAAIAHVAGEPHVHVALVSRPDDRLPDALRSLRGASLHLRRSRASRRTRAAAERRLAALEDGERHAVELLAIAGGPVDAAIVADLAGASEVRLLEQDDVIVGDRTDRRIDLRLVHRSHVDLVAATTDEEIVRLRRRALADAIEARGARRRDDALRIALLRRHDDDPAAVAVLVDAADRCLATHRNASVQATVPEIVTVALAECARRLAGHALERGGGMDAVEILSRALDRLGRVDEVRALLDDADRHVVDGDDEARLVGLRARLAAKGGRDERATATLEQELAIASPDRRPELLGARIDVLVLGGRTAEAVVDGDELLAAGLLTARVAAPYALALAQCGRPVDALAQADPILAAREGIEYDAVGLAAIARIAALVELGRLDEAAQLGALVVGAADGTDEIGFQAVSRLMSAMVEVAAGRVAAGAALADAAAARFDATETLGLRGGALGVAAAAHAQAGDLTAARARLRAAEATTAEPRALHHTVAHGRAWWLLVEGHRDRAVRELLDVAARLRESGGASTELLVLHDVVRIGEASGVVARLRALADVSQGPLGRLAADHAVALLAGDAGGLDDVAARAEGHGMLLVAADAAAQAARVHEQHGDPADAAASRARCDDLIARCEGAFTPQTATERRRRG